MLFKKLYGICICDAGEIRIHNVCETLDKTLVHELVEECHLFGSILKNILDDELDHVFLTGDNVIEICKCHLRLDHPELCGMALSVGILGTEGRSEGINVSESLCKGLAVKLSRNGKRSLLAEEIL